MTLIELIEHYSNQVSLLGRDKADINLETIEPEWLIRQAVIKTIDDLGNIVGTPTTENTPIYSLTKKDTAIENESDLWFGLYHDDGETPF